MLPELTQWDSRPEIWKRIIQNQRKTRPYTRQHLLREVGMGRDAIKIFSFVVEDDEEDEEEDEEEEEEEMEGE